MSDQSRVLCKYYVSGVCRFGADCAFSHNLTDLPNLVCKFYLAGCCAYGDRCRYDHKRPEYWKARQKQQQQQQAVRSTGAAQQHQRGNGTATAPAAPATSVSAGPSTAHDGSRGRVDGSGGGGVESSGGGSAFTGTHGLYQRAAATWEAGPNPLERQLPRSLYSDNSTRDGGASGGGGRATAPGGAGAVVVDSWEDAADGHDEYDNYEADEGLDDEEGYYGCSYDPQHGYSGHDAAAYDDAYCEGYDDGGGGGDGDGLIVIDDDVGLAQEQLEARAAAAGARRPLTSLLGGAAVLSPSSHWTAPPWAAAALPGGAGAASAGTAQFAAERAGSSSAAAVATAAAADPLDLSEVELCPGFSLHGRCAEGEDCPLIHGLECEICHKFWIHPYNEEAASEHRSTCRLRHERLEARLRSSGIECGICLESVLLKPSVAERRFGLLACDHPFCLTCIRSWRGRTDDETLATDTAVRTCPTCRTPSHFVTPSLVWPATPEEKAVIVAAYKDHLATIDCKHFNFGEGSCPFSTSCFYRHMHRDGRLEERVVRRAGNADGDVRVVMPVRLSAFFDTPQAQRLLSRRR